MFFDVLKCGKWHCFPSFLYQIFKFWQICDFVEELYLKIDKKSKKAT